MGKLSAARVKSITKQGLHGDGGTLYLAVAKSGSKSWVQRVTIDGRRRDIGLGGYPYVGLAAARQSAMDNCTAIAAGRDPLAVVDWRRLLLTLRWRDGLGCDGVRVNPTAAVTTHDFEATTSKKPIGLLIPKEPVRPLPLAHSDLMS